MRIHLRDTIITKWPEVNGNCVKKKKTITIQWDVWSLLVVRDRYVDVTTPFKGDSMQFKGIVLHVKDLILFSPFSSKYFPGLRLWSATNCYERGTKNIYCWRCHRHEYTGLARTEGTKWSGLESWVQAKW